jgi:hypothetical protein
MYVFHKYIIIDLCQNTQYVDYVLVKFKIVLIVLMLKRKRKYIVPINDAHKYNKYVVILIHKYL